MCARMNARPKRRVRLPGKGALHRVRGVPAWSAWALFFAAVVAAAAIGAWLDGADRGGGE